MTLHCHKTISCNFKLRPHQQVPKQHCRMLQVVWFFRQSRMLLRQIWTLLRHCCRWKQRRTSFSSCRQNWNILNKLPWKKLYGVDDIVECCRCQTVRVLFVYLFKSPSYSECLLVCWRASAVPFGIIHPTKVLIDFPIAYCNALQKRLSIQMRTTTYLKPGPH